MDETFINQPLFWPSVLLCLGIYVIMYVIRTIFESSWPALKTTFLWRELALPIGPILVGALFALLASKYPWPTLVVGSLSAKILYGSVCGICSGWIYGRFRAYLKALADKAPESRSL